jgi:hypothetical protein
MASIMASISFLARPHLRRAAVHHHLGERNLSVGIS